MAKIKTYLVTKELTTDAKKSAIKEWEKEPNMDSSTRWVVKKVTIQEVDEGCCG